MSFHAFYFGFFYSSPSCAGPLLLFFPSFLPSPPRFKWGGTNFRVIFSPLEGEIPPFRRRRSLPPYVFFVVLKRSKEGEMTIVHSLFSLYTVLFVGGG